MKDKKQPNVVINGKSFFIVETRVRRGLRWILTRQGRHDAGAVIATVTALYTALHRAGVL